MTRSLLLAALLSVGALTLPLRSVAQSFRGSTGSMLGGALLGAYSGAGFGLLGSMLPCNRTLSGQTCTLSGVSAAGALGLAMGGLVGAQNQDLIIDRFQAAGIGMVVGAFAGLGLRRAVRQYQWEDVAAMSLLGGVIGGAPRGALIGVGIGTATGALVYALFPKAGVPDVIMFGLAGLAIGGLIDWGAAAGSAKADSTPVFVSSFSIGVR